MPVRPRRLALLPGGLLLLVLPLALLAAPPAALLAPARAQDELTPEEEEQLEEITYQTERAWQAFRSGSYDEVLARLERVAGYDEHVAIVPLLRGRVAERRGDYQEALAQALRGVTRHPDHVGLASLRYRVLLETGQVGAAATAARAALATTPDDIIALAALGRSLEVQGRREEALAAYDAVIETYNAGRHDPEELPWVAHAAIRATWLSPNEADDMIPAALKLLERHIEDHGEDSDALVMLADVYQENRGKRGQSLAAKYFKQALDRNPEIPAAWVGLARTQLVFYQQDAALRSLTRALQINERFVPALVLLAAIHVGNGDYEQAEEHLDRALEVNPRHREARSVRAGLLYIRGEKEAYEELVSEILADDPTYGRVHLTVSELVGERQRRYDLAADLARQAIEVDPADHVAYVVLGEALMNLGRTDEAREVFEEAVARSKRYRDVKRDNWREVLGVLEDFEVQETEHFVVRYHPSEADVMRHYLPDLLEEAWATLNEKYGFTPQAPVLVDSFHRADDFSVRSVGVPGLPALGVCFGGVITVLGPTSRPVGSFSWSRTTWHEYAHVVTLQLSEGQVPRWLTEGLSVYEEKARRSDWGREMQRQLFDRFHNGRLLAMDRINRAFRGPDILWAYFQGGLIAEHLTETRGFEVIPAMLRAFARDRTTAQVFQDVLDLELDAYDALFREFVEGIVGDWQLVPRWDEASMRAFRARVEADEEDAEAWTRLAWGHLQRGRSVDAGEAFARARRLAPDDVDVILLEGRLAQVNGRKDLAAAAYRRVIEAGGDDFEMRLFLAALAKEAGGDSEEAIRHLEAAKRCFPDHVGKESPYLQLAALYRGAGRLEDAVAELEGYAAIAAEDYGVRRELKGFYRGRDDHERVAELCGQMVDISPFGANRGEDPDLELHRDYAAALLALEREEEARRELEVQVALLGRLDEQARRDAGAVATHTELGRLFLEDDRPFEALEQAIAALRLAPDDAAARMLKARAEEAAGYR